MWSPLLTERVEWTREGDAGYRRAAVEGGARHLAVGSEQRATSMVEEFCGKREGEEEEEREEGIRFEGGSRFSRSRATACIDACRSREAEDGSLVSPGERSISFCFRPESAPFLLRTRDQIYPFPNPHPVIIRSTPNLRKTHGRGYGKGKNPI
jgi:hypothetical protein